MMNTKDFTEQQQQSVLDLLVLAMYADGHLASVEDARVQRWLVTMGFDTEFDRNREFDASIARVRQHSQNALAAATHADTLARCFTTQEHRRRVYDVLEDLLQSDSQVAAQESTFLSTLKEKFQL